MKRLHWYIIKSFLGPFFMTFFIVVFILLMQFLWKYVDDLVGKGLDFAVLGEMIFYAAFGLLPYAFPLAMLLASLMTFGSLGENYELVAMKSSGISLHRIMKPLFVIAIIISATAFYFSNNILPHTNLKFTTLLWSVKQQRPELVLQEGVFTNEMDGYSIRVGSKDNNTNMLKDLLIYDHTNNKTNESVTVADSGYLRITEDKKFMVLNLYNGVNYSETARSRKEQDKFPFRRDRFDEQTIRVKVRGFDFNRRDDRIFKNTYRMLNIDQLRFMEDSLGNDYKKRLNKFIMEINLNSATISKIYNLTVSHDSLKRDIQIQPDSIFDFDEFFERQDNWVKAEITQSALSAARGNVQTLNMYDDQLYNRKKTLNKYSMERHKKYTLSLAVLIFFFIGAPLGAIIRKGGLGMPVVISILMFIAYYIISMTGEKSAREDVWDMAGGMWFSTFVFLPLGIWLSYKAATDAALMSAETYSKLFSKLGIDKLTRKFSKKNEDTSGNQ
ncbi:lipopolysaccharide export system permease protein [Tangfeifania diversioriginum]|uniref:Lipopolysaccharide export system permease protein n=1 Tax=Tangfeifania diversioriginum TaxID=1168035 RepID=A0A1M6H3S7_9BACT|nr:LptF/LptG family permease [Tangfeifania diversioriginum]SHJ16840.1 lipopolysaccharide export system permease protein [Tangfeifania diversioriginum]